MRSILRNEMGFDGVLISDWAAIEEIIYHGYCADKEEAAIRAVEAGVDIDMMTGIYCDNLCRLVREGKIAEELVDEGCMRILELKNKLGLFENPYKDADEEKEKELILCREHRELAREVARKSFVLLKNEEEILPLDKKVKTAFIGPYVNNRNLMGAWSFIGEAKDIATVEEIIKQEKMDENLICCQGSPMLGTDVVLEGFTEATQSACTSEEQETDSIHASVSVKNTGKCVGTETVQLYIPDVAASVVRPVKELKDFRKIMLEPGEEIQVKFEITESQLRFISENDIFESEAGVFEIYIGTDSTTNNKVKFTLEK